MTPCTNSSICLRASSVGAAPAMPIMELISWMRYASMSKLQALSSAIAAIESFNLSNAFSAIALLKFAIRPLQSAAAAALVSASDAESDSANRLQVENIRDLP